MKLSIFTYFLGSLYIVNTIFHSSFDITHYLFKNKYIELPYSKFDKIYEVIYSSLHSIFISFFSFFCFESNTIQYGQLLDISLYNKSNDNDLMVILLTFSLSYFCIDLLRCLYLKKYLFIVHHCSAILLLCHHLYLISNQYHHGIYAIHTLFLLEFNTILLNIGFLLKEYKFHYSIICSSWMIHLFFFTMFRLIQVPKVFFVYIKNDFHFFHTVLQLPNVFVIYMGSTYWAYRQWKGIQKYLKENCVI
jgi:hypothetical protein